MHKPVLQKEVLDCLDPKANENFIDCTIGEGGHAAAILKKNGPKGEVLGIETDIDLYQMLEIRMAEFSNRLIVVNDSYINLKNIVEKYNFSPINGILLDLGMSSWHLGESSRGFSFQSDEALDMRYSFSNNSLTAGKIINNYSEDEIEKILREYGEERFAKRIAKRIVREREIKPIKSTLQLVKIIKDAVPPKYRFSRIHPATRTFQALRIVVNDELNNLRKVLPQTIEVLSPSGRLIVISFHSLEDRIVKNFLKENNQYLKILTKKPIIATEEEIKNNPRARSAKMRVAIKI